MPFRNVDRMFGFVLHDVARLFRKEYNNRVRELGVTRSQWRVIANLYRNEGVTQTELADILEIEPATLARLLDRLEAADWVERRPCEKDRRAKRLHLTDRPAQYIDRMFEVSTEIEHDALSGMSAEEKERLITVLLMIKRNLLSLADTPAEPAEPARKVASGG